MLGKAIREMADATAKHQKTLRAAERRARDGKPLTTNQMVAMIEEVIDRDKHKSPLQGEELP